MTHRPIETVQKPSTIERRNARCWVHHTKRALAQGSFGKPKRRWAFARMVYDNGEEVDAQIHRRALHASQRHLWSDLEGRYFAIARSGTVHLCVCRWTKEMLGKVEAEADQLWRGLNTQCATVSKHG